MRLENPDLHTSGHIVGKADVVPSSSLWRLCPDHAQTEINPAGTKAGFVVFSSITCRPSWTANEGEAQYIHFSGALVVEHRS